MSLTLTALTRRFGAVSAVDDLTTEIPSGRITGFLGPNGSGKSTTLRMLVGLVAPTSGSALIDGMTYSRLPDPRRVVGTALSAEAFHPGRRGRDHLRILALPLGIGAERIEEVLEMVGLTDAASRRVGSYSLGMRQRLALAGALLADPRTLLLDEPANGLDPEGMAWLRGLLRDQANAGRTVLVSSHVLAEVAQTVDHIVVIARGRLRYEGPLADLTGDGESLEAAFLRLTTQPDQVSAVGEASA